MSPREFWRLTLEEFMWLWDAKNPAKVHFAGTRNAMSADELAELAVDTFGE
jgi:hypothetical protein